jgi:acyl-CoA thioester hydrolase
MAFTCSLRARYAETDQMGIIYHANYLTWFEIARTEYMRSLGLSYRDVESLGIMLPVAEASCRYLAPAHYDDQLEIRISLTALGAASMRFEYEVYRPTDDTLLARGSTKQAFVGMDMRPLNGKRKVPEFWQRLHAELQQA